MKRDIIKIDEDKCNGCSLCVPNCYEGALRVIDGKVRLVSELMCDGLGACIGHCPEGAITIEQRESEPYNEVKVMEIMASKGFNTIVAHLKHLKVHNETSYLKQGMAYLIENAKQLNYNIEDVKRAIHQEPTEKDAQVGGFNGGCPESKTVVINPSDLRMNKRNLKDSLQSQLRQWPVQLHLINPSASYFVNSDLLVAADCTAFTLGDFHQNWLKGKSLVIACPKLDQGKEIYFQKLVTLAETSKINTITVLIMEVPCCGGLLKLIEMAVHQAGREISIKAVKVGIKGEILEEVWI